MKEIWDGMILHEIAEAGGGDGGLSEWSEIDSIKMV